MNECDSNWKRIVKESEPLLDKKFEWNYDGKIYTFFGIVHGSDDYYYGMCDEDNKVVLASCVGSITGNGFTPIKRK